MIGWPITEDELLERLDKDSERMYSTGLVPQGSTPLAFQAAAAIRARRVDIRLLVEVLRDWEDEKALDSAAYMPPDHSTRVKARELLARLEGGANG